MTVIGEIPCYTLRYLAMSSSRFVVFNRTATSRVSVYRPLQSRTEKFDITRELWGGGLVEGTAHPFKGGLKILSFHDRDTNSLTS